jgi:hypothetical protein
MRAVLRILCVIPLGFVAAMIAASATIVLSAGLAAYPDEPPGFFTAKLVVASLAAATFVGSVAAIPSLLAIALAEIFGWRSFVLHLVAGTVIGLVAFLTGIGGAPPVASDDLVVGGAAGAVGGFVYWLVAGRGAGFVPPPRKAEPQSPG